MKKISFCIPWHDTGKCQRRTDIFNYLKNYYETEIVPQYEGSELVVAGDNSGEKELNRSRMRNNCAKIASGEILFFIDADCYLSKYSIDKAIEKLTEGVGMVQYTRVSWVREDNTKNILYNNDASCLLKGEPSDELWGLVFVVRRVEYFKIGGFSEDFKAWGWEDPAFIITIKTLVGRLEKVSIDFPAIHLEHPRGQEHDSRSVSFKKNKELHELFKKAAGNPSAMRKLLNIPEPQLINVYASAEHYAEHMAPVFAECAKRGIAGKFVVWEYFWWRLKPIFEENNFPIEKIVFVKSDFEAVQLFKRIEGMVLVAGIGDAAPMREAKKEVIIMEHGAGQTYGNRQASFVGGVGRDDFSMIVVPREKLKQLSQRFYPKIFHSDAGCPKLDWYVGKEHGNAVCISFHWHTTFCPEADFAFNEYKDSLAQLKNLCTQRGVELIGHAHPRSRELIFPVYRQLGIRIVDNFYDVCKEASVYICDNSSTIFEFAALGRPVVLLNSKFYRKSVNYGLRFWTNTDVGVQVDSPQEIVDIVGKVLDNEVEIDANAINRVYNNIGCSSVKVVDDIQCMMAMRRPSSIKEKYPMAKMIVQRDIMLQGKHLEKGAPIEVNEAEARRLESYFVRGVPAASRQLEPIFEAPEVLRSPETATITPEVVPSIEVAGASRFDNLENLVPVSMGDEGSITLYGKDGKVKIKGRGRAANVSIK